MASTQTAIDQSSKWIGLAMTPGIGAGRGKKLVEFFGGVDGHLLGFADRTGSCGLPAAAAQSIALGKSLELAGEEFDRLRELGATAVVPGDTPLSQPAAGNLRSAAHPLH